MRIRGHSFLSILTIILLVMAGHGYAFSQEPLFDNFLEEDGLPSNEIYDMLPASDGYLWFATANGVSRFDGSEFLNFNINEGLAAPLVLKLYEDQSGRIWFIANDGTLSYYQHGMVKPYEYNDTLLKYFPDNYFGKIYIDPAHNMFLSPRQGGKGMIDARGHLTFRPDLVPRIADSCYLFFADHGNDHFLSILIKMTDTCISNGDLFLCGDGYYLAVEHTNKEFHRHFIRTGQGKYLVSYRNRVYTIDNDHLVNTRCFEDEVICMYADDHGQIWIGVKYANGVYIFADASLSGDPAHIMDGYTITGVIQDREGYYWLSSEGNGIFNTVGFEFNVYSIPGLGRNVKLLSMDLYHDRLWFSTSNKEVYSGHVSKGRIDKFRKLDIEEPVDWIRHIMVDRDGYLWMSSTWHLRYDPAGFAAPPDTVINFSFVGRGSGDTVLVANTRLGFYHNSILKNIIFPAIERRIYCAFQNRNDIWLGTLYGLHLYRDGVFIALSTVSPILADRINCIGRIGKLLVLGTATRGLAFLNGDSLVLNISEDAGLRGNTITSIFVQNDSVLWAGTKNGLHRIRLAQDPGFTYSIESFGPGDGLPVREINAIAMHEGYIWLAADIGLVSFDPQVVKPKLVPPLININSLQINGMDTTIDSHFVLRNDQNDIRIGFQAISFRKGGGLRYKYKMEGYSDNFIVTNNTYADFPNLPPGQYTFVLEVSNTQNIWNEAPREINFVIKENLTQTAGFLIFLIIASLGILLSLSLFLQRQRRVRQEARAELARMEQRIFRLQMNPHFVFNALLAIQGFMYQRNVHDAGRYLTNFAKLIRHTLYGSSEELMALDKEIEAMRYYLELQQLRFNNNFQFTIKVSEDIIPELIEIPPLLIQPFLENAIEHGLQHKRDGNGQLRLSFTRNDRDLEIEINDNGIGREQAMKIQKKRGRLHKSLGINIVGQRIASLNKLTGNNIRLGIFDLNENEDGTTGTLVKISIPVHG